MTGNSTFANNAGKINKLVMVFAFNPGILTTFCQGVSRPLQWY
jgi:hypothetical protein